LTFLKNNDSLNNHHDFSCSFEFPIESGEKGRGFMKNILPAIAAALILIGCSTTASSKSYYVDSHGNKVKILDGISGILVRPSKNLHLDQGTELIVNISTQNGEILFHDSAILRGGLFYHADPGAYVMDFEGSVGGKKCKGMAEYMVILNQTTTIEVSLVCPVPRVKKNT